jgi:predicted RNA binding protein YcfA (HicA-like mRNA interferase family)
MKTPRDLSGQELVEVLCRKWGYRQIEQEGSHILLETDDPIRQRISVPGNRVLRVGTLHAILRTVARHKGVNRDAILGNH